MDKTRITNEHDICIMACFNKPNGDEVCYDYYPTDDELEKILIDTVKKVLDVDYETARLLITTTSTVKHWAKLLDDYFDSSTMDNYANIYELWYDEEVNGRK